MAKKDMDTYHSRLTQVDLDELIVKYNIPCDLYPRLPSKGFLMFELLVGSFGAQQGCYLRGAFQSLQIEPTVTLFRQEDVRRLSAYIVKLRDIPEGVLVLSGLSQGRDPILRGSDGNESDDDEDACIEIPMITPLRSAAVIPPEGN
nr:hypothetical protein [Tanacetum cinerariifolium]